MSLTASAMVVLNLLHVKTIKNKIRCWRFGSQRCNEGDEAAAAGGRDNSRTPLENLMLLCDRSRRQPLKCLETLYHPHTETNMPMSSVKYFSSTYFTPHIRL